MLSLSSFAYKARSVNLRYGAAHTPIAPGTFSVAFHHGSAYSVDLAGNKGRGVMGALALLLGARAEAHAEPTLRQGAIEASIRYWRLRYGGDRGIDFSAPNKVMERTHVLDPARVLQPTQPQR